MPIELLTEKMETKHTQRPWRYESTSVGSNYVRIFCSPDKDEGEGDTLRGYCSEAKAQLIVTAPDLLKEAQELISKLKTMVDLHESHYAGLDAAIRKATEI